jgi:hypothetical protein
MATPGDVTRIGELLIEEGVVSHEEMLRGIADSAFKGTPLGALLETTPHVRRADLAGYLAANYRVPVIEDLRRVELNSSLAQLVPEDLARKHELIPIGRAGGILLVAKSNYYNRAAVQDLRNAVEAKIKVLQADEEQVRAALDRIYRGKGGDLPAPTSKGKPTTVRRLAPQPSPVLEAVPLIEQPAEDAVKAGRMAPPSATVDEVIEIMDALKIPSQEYATAARDPLARVVVDFEESFQSGRAVAAQRL